MEMRLPSLLILVFLLITAPPATGQQTSAHYVPMKDGIRLAVDVNLPANIGPGERVPALFEITRYGRSRENPETGQPIPSLGRLDRFFLENGYAVVKVDARGSGASFGTRPAEYSPQEVRDGYAVVDWVIKQSWSDGKVGAYGTSYSGTTAELLAAVNHPAVKAVIPGWSDFDLYASPARPYGLLASAFIKTWSDYVQSLDKNDVLALRSSIRRVDEDVDGSLLAAALRDHRSNPNVFELGRSAEFRDDRWGPYGWEALTPLHWRKEIQKSGVPMLVLVSWLDAGTTEGALLRFMHFSNPQNVVILASSHGGRFHASPYRVGGETVPADPDGRVQAQMRLDYFDYHLKGKKNGVDQWPRLRYYNLGEEAYRESATWPLPGTNPRRMYFAAGNALSNDPPINDTGSDVYQVDPGVSTGVSNRWMTQMGRPVLNLDDRAEMNERMLTYTGMPVGGDLQIAGQPIVKLLLSSDRTDGMVLAYLEDVDETGRSRYLTEGGLRLIHRKTVPDPYFGDAGPYHSFARADAKPMAPGEVAEVNFKMQPIAALIKAGHRLRISIAGADADTFDPLPATGAATLTVQRSSTQASYIELPVVATARR